MRSHFAHQLSTHSLALYGSVLLFLDPPTNQANKQIIIKQLPRCIKLVPLAFLIFVSSSTTKTVAIRNEIKESQFHSK